MMGLNPDDVIYIDMDAPRHSTQKKMNTGNVDQPTTEANRFANLLEDSAREAYNRPWHRIERGLRLNRLRIFVEDIAPQHDMTKDEKDLFFVFLQQSLDRKLLNTLKVVIYDQGTQRITAIKGLEMKRQDGSALKWEFSVKKAKTDVVGGTRKKKKEEVPSLTTIIPQVVNVKIDNVKIDDVTP